MSFFQITAVLFALFMMYVVRIHKRKSGLGMSEVSFWYSVWGLFIVIALFPNLLLNLAGILNFTRVFDLLTVAAFMILTFIIISTYLSQKETARNIENLIRKQAIKKTALKNLRKKKGHL
jgi:hypothetical protein